MTFRSFFFYSFLQWLLLAILKVAFFRNDFLGNAGLQNLLFLALTFMVVVACVRRLGVVNYLEAILIIFVWVVGNALGDLIITSIYTGIGIFSMWSLWVGYLVSALTIMLLHKKRHIEIRKEQHAHHHGHGHGHGAAKPH